MPQGAMPVLVGVGQVTDQWDGTAGPDGAPSPKSLCVTASKLALDDAGIAASEIDTLAVVRIFEDSVPGDRHPHGHNTNLPGTIARTVPESWHWPEWMARKAVDEPTIVEAGIRLIRSQNPKAWEELATAQLILSANREALARCHERALKTEQPVNCTIKLAP